MTPEIERRIQAIICEQLDLRFDQISMKTRFIEDLGVDSLAVVDLALALEEEFAIKIPDDEVDRIKTVEDVVNLANAHIHD